MVKIARLFVCSGLYLASAAVAQVSMPWRMTTNQVNYQINYSLPPAGDQALYRAAATWNSAGSRLQFVADGLTSVNENSQYASSDTPGVQISTRPASISSDPYWHAFTWRTAATTTTTSDADITLNGDRIAAGVYYYETGTPPSNQYDYQSLITHELGHVAGFDHDATSTTCLMRSGLPPGSLKRTLCSGETTALRNKYP